MYCELVTAQFRSFIHLPMLSFALMVLGPTKRAGGFMEIENRSEIDVDHRVRAAP